jgi:hypothetical protein
MPQFLYYNVNVQFRIPISDDGKVGQPEMYKKFVTEMKNGPAAVSSTKRKVGDMTAEKGEDSYLE